MMFPGAATAKGALVIAPESLYGLSTLTKKFEGLERMYRAGYAAAEAIPEFLES